MLSDLLENLGCVVLELERSPQLVRGGDQGPRSAGGGEGVLVHLPYKKQTKQTKRKAKKRNDLCLLVYTTLFFPFFFFPFPTFIQAQKTGKTIGLLVPWRTVSGRERGIIGRASITSDEAYLYPAYRTHQKLAAGTQAIEVALKTYLSSGCC